jgi:hypothetical protein
LLLCKVFNSIKKSIAGQLERALACAYFEELGIGKLMAALSTYQCSLPLAALSTHWWMAEIFLGLQPNATSGRISSTKCIMFPT